MSSPAPHSPDSTSRRRDDLDKHASPEAGAQAATDDGFRKARSTLLAIGTVSAAVLTIGGAAGIFAITNGDVAPATMAGIVVAASVVVVLVTVASAVMTVHRTLTAPAVVERRPEAERRQDVPAPEPRPADPTAGGIAPAAPPGPPPRELPQEQSQSPEVFSRIAGRLQAKVSRAFVDLDALERRIEDPELLATVFRLDHLITRIRREVENLSVLGGDAPQPRSSQPAEVNQVLRLAVASTEDYQRITTFPVRGIKMHGHVVAGLINLLAELLDNATAFTPPHAPKIALTASRVAAGLAIEVHDRGIGMAPEDIERVNRLLAGYTDVDLHQLLDEGRIGFAVVNRLAPRHNIRVQLRSNIFGGIDAAVVIPHNLLTESGDLYTAPHTEGQTRLEPGMNRGAARIPVRAHAQPAPPDWPWPAPGNPAGGSTDVLTNTRRAMPGPAAPDGTGPSSFPRSPAETDNGHGGLRQVPMASDAVPSAGKAAPPPANRPPLPQRGSETYLRPELRQPPQVARIIPGHNPDLLTDVMRGREDAEIDNNDGGQ
ncbi:sensor histidine kinase [Pseudonocardia xinjiangensis]|uniref:sensor histidine kinase n=1 Tax=Pseudonocardia xinjiangensis TaxID=75289 RepID=UPI003D90CCA1